MKKLLITVILLVCVSIISFTIMISLYLTRPTECKYTSLVQGTFAEVVFELGVDITKPSMQLTISFTDLVTPKPLYYLVVYRVGAFQFVTRELLPSVDGFHQESVPVSYLVDPILFEAQITRVESSEKSFESIKYKLNPFHLVPKPIPFSRIGLKKTVILDDIAPKKQIQKIETIDHFTRQLKTANFTVAVTDTGCLVFSDTPDTWYTLVDEMVIHWNVCSSSNHVVYANQAGLMYVLNLQTENIEPVLKLDEKDNTLAVCFPNENCIVTLTIKKLSIFMKDHGVWTRLIEMVAEKFTDVAVQQISRYVYTVQVRQENNTLTEYTVDIYNKTIFK